MQLPLPLNDVTIPAGLPAWLVTFVSRAREENQMLIENGAGHAAAARLALLNRLVVAAQEYVDSEVTVEEAATLLGKHPETIRRAIRKGALPDDRTQPRGRMHIRRGDLELLAGPRTKGYDPIADAHGIAQRRRK
jgi:excisionase family DNA binding protein